MADGTVNVNDSGPKVVDCTEITRPDGTVVERQRTDIGDGTDIPAIRRMLEELYVKVLWGDAEVPLPAGRTASFDENGNVEVSLGVAFSGGCRVSRLIALGTTNATLVKPSAGQIYGWYLFNAAAATRFLKLYSSKVKPVVGTDVPVMTIGIPAGAAANVAFPNGIGDFSQGIGFATTVNAADSDATAVTANDLIIQILYA